jgi:hypothetical protein
VRRDEKVKRMLSAAVHPADARRLLAQGSFYSGALQLSNASAVLPLICAELASVWVAALLYPLFCIGLIGGYTISPWLLGRARHLKHLTFSGGTVAMAALIAGAAIATKHTWYMESIFIVAAAGLGVAKGVSDGAHAELVAARLPQQRRGDLLLREGAVSAVIVTVATLLVVPWLSSGSFGGGHAAVLWLGAIGMVAAAASALRGGPVHAHAGAPVLPLRHLVSHSFGAIRTHRWFRRHLVVRLLFVPIGLAELFYSLHASTENRDTMSRVPLALVCISAGVLIGSYLWRAVCRAAGVRGMLLWSSTIAVATAAVCGLGHLAGLWPQTWLCGLVILLSAVANTAVWAGVVEWLGMLAGEHERATLMGVGMVAAAAATALMGLVIGAIAPVTGALWPVTILLSLNMIAVIAATSAPDNVAAGAAVRKPSDGIQHVGESIYGVCDVGFQGGTGNARVLCLDGSPNKVMVAVSTENGLRDLLDAADGGHTGRPRGPASAH